jgi:hypothetical protein
MASIQYGAMVNSIKGKVGGTIFQGGNGAAIVKSKGRALLRNAPRVQAQKQIIGYLAQLWNQQSSATMQAWQAACASYPSTDRFGNTRLPSAFALWMKLNGRLMANGIAIATNPTIPTPGTSIIGLTFSNTFYNIMQIAVPTPLDISSEVLTVWATAPTTAGRKTAPGGFKIIYSGSLGGGYLQDLYSNWSVIYGAGFAGMVVNFKFRLLTAYNGAYSVPITIKLQTI